MKRTLRYALLASVFSAAAVFAQTPVTGERNGISFSILIRGAEAEITVSAAVRGWVGIGFNPTNRMKDADFLIGYVKDGVAFARDDFGTGTGSHRADVDVGGTNNIISFSGTEKDGVTTMTFVVPVDSGDSKDSKLLPGKHSVILGASNSDNFTGIHSKIGKVDIVLP